MGELVFVGLGLFDEKDVSLRGLEVAKKADFVFAELYTSLMKGFKVERLERLVGKKIVVVSRKMLEEESGRPILAAASSGRTVLLVPGDPLVATTHVDLRLQAEKAGINTRVVHGASIISAVIGLSGLQNYKFGRSVTIPFADNGVVSETPYNVIKDNLKMGVHTLCFLDVRAEENRYMTVNEALQALLSAEAERRESVIERDTLVVGIARAGSENPTVEANRVEKFLNFNLGDPPHTLVFPGMLHFVEAEALVKLAGAPEEIRKLVK